MTDRKETLGERLKRLRLHKNLSVKDVAAAIGVPVTTYREWENGRKIVGEPYKELSQILGVGLYELITGEKWDSQSVVGSVVNIEAELRKIKDYLLSVNANESGIRTRNEN